jgi:hypothetical protein
MIKHISADHAFVSVALISDVTDPVRPVVLGFLPTTTVPSSWRDMKIYKNYVYIGAEAPDHGSSALWFDIS